MTPAPKYLAFLKNYQQSSNITQSAIKAGFSPQYADKQGKYILNRALKIQAQELMDRANNNQVTAKEGKQLMREILGISRESLLDNAKWLANQEKDLSVRLKVITPLLKEENIDLSSEDTQKVTVPILNVVVEKTGNGLIKPPIDTE